MVMTYIWRRLCTFLPVEKTFGDKINVPLTGTESLGIWEIELQTKFPTQKNSTASCETSDVFLRRAARGRAW